VALSPIDCQEVLRRIELYLDGELDDVLRVEIEEHLVLCGPCTHHSDFQRGLKALLRAKCGCDEVPPHVLERITRILHAEAPPGA
jgi:mycothiol system anti-sigma-R factor